ncbi:alpha/beta hydrolase [Chloroflexota bacterium]
MSTNKTDKVKERSKNRSSRILKWLAIVVILLLALAYFGIGYVAAGQLTQPKRQFDPENNPAVYNLEYEDVQFPSSDGKAEIAAWYIPYQGSSQVVIMVHGNNASRTREYDDQFPSMGAALHQAGFNVLMIDLRGHGESSDGRVTFGTSERYDVIGAVDWLVAKGFQPGSIGVLGVSLGSASSIGATLEAPAVGALVVDSAFAEIYPVIQNQWQDASGLPNLFLTPTRLMVRLLYGYDLAGSNPVDEIGGIAPRPIMIIHCKTDDYVPLAHAERMKDAAPDATTWYLEQCEHARAYNAERQNYENKVSSFFIDNLK